MLKKRFVHYIYFETLSIHCNAFQMESSFIRTSCCCFFFHSFLVLYCKRKWHLEITQSHAFKVLFSCSSLYFAFALILLLAVCFANFFFVSSSSNANACFLTFSVRLATTPFFHSVQFFSSRMFRFSLCARMYAHVCSILQRHKRNGRKKHQQELGKNANQHEIECSVTNV